MKKKSKVAVKIRNTWKEGEFIAVLPTIVVDKTSIVFMWIIWALEIETDEAMQ